MFVVYKINCRVADVWRINQEVPLYCLVTFIPDIPFVPATDVDVNKDDAEDALHPSGEEPSPDELDEAVEEDEADLPTFGRPNSPLPPSDIGRPEPIMAEVVIEPKPEDSL